MAKDLDFLRELRINPIVPSESVLVATERSQRPRKKAEIAPRDTRDYVPECPFCPGHEERTPPTLRAWPAEGDWHIRIVENLFPVLGNDSPQTRLLFGHQQAISGYGRHEVIIDHHRHGIALHEMSDEHVAALWRAYQERMRELYSDDERIHYVLVFKNFGPAAGASLAHTHSQMVAMPVVPENVFNELSHTRHYTQQHGSCIFCNLIDEALTFEATLYNRQSGEVHRRIDCGQYVVERGEHVIAIKPFASRYEWEVHLLPLQHQADFLQASEEVLDDLARVLRRTLARLNVVVEDVQYNYFLHTLPHDDAHADCKGSYHWHVEVCPRTSIPSGFELGSGLFVNTVSPEQAAEQLRAVSLPDQAP